MSLEKLIDRGNGPAVVFSHGMLMDATMFTPQIDALAEQYRCLSYDSRTLQGQVSKHDLDDLAEDCKALLDEQGIDRCVLVGHSMGGFMGTVFALKYPERLDGLVLIGACAAEYTEEEKAQNTESFAMLDMDGLVPEPFAQFCQHIGIQRRHQPEQSRHGWAVG